MQYVGFLLGINVGRRIVKMAVLKIELERLGYTEVHTVLASGNVIFSTKVTSPTTLEKKLEAALSMKWGFPIEVIVREIGELHKLAATKPFKGVTVTPSTRCYVTFLSQTAPKSEKARVITDAYRILKVSPREVLSVLELNPAMKTPDVMKLLGKAFGKKITTRNWNTLEKILLLGSVQIVSEVPKSGSQLPAHNRTKLNGSAGAVEHLS